MKPRISPSSVRAQTIAMSAIVPFVIHILVAVEDPVGAVAPRVRPHRAGIGAGVRLGQAEAADHLAGVHPAAATAPSAPPSPSARSRTSRATPAPRRRCGSRSRPPRAPGTRARRRRRSRPEARSRAGASRRGRASRAPRSTSRGRMPCSNQSPTSGSDLLADELPHRVADRLLLVVEQRVEGEEVERVERGAARRSVAATCRNLRDRDGRYAENYIEKQRTSGSGRRRGPAPAGAA